MIYSANVIRHETTVSCIVCAYVSDSRHNIPTMDVDAFKAFEAVREVTDYVQVHLSDPSFVSLRYLRNLRIIQGRHLSR